MRRISLIVGICIAVLVTVAVVRRLPPPPEKPVLSRDKSSQILLDWKDPRRITLNLDNVPIETALAELQRQSGVPVSSFHRKEIVSLHFDDLRFWDAIAQTSIRSKVPFLIGMSHDDVDFGLTPLAGVPSQYVIAGPFCIALSKQDIHPRPVLALDAHVLAREGAVRRSGIRNVVAVREGAEPVWLEPTLLNGQWGSGDYWLFPSTPIDEKTTLRGDMPCEVRRDAVELLVPVPSREPVAFPNFGGISIRALKGDDAVGQPVVRFEVDWKSGLDEADSTALAKFVAMASRIAPTDPNLPAKLAEVDEWLESKSDALRLLAVVKMELRDADGAPLPFAGTFLKVSDGEPHLEGEVSYKDGKEPAVLALTLADRKIATAVFSFKGPIAD